MYKEYSMLDKLKDLEFNGGGGKAHELLVYKQLENSGYVAGDFTQLAQEYNTNKTGLRDLLEQGSAEIDDGVFYYQPCGSQQSPDFIFMSEDELVLLECKSSKTSKPMWNSHIIKQNYLYFISTQNGTVLSKGDSLMSPNTAKELAEFGAYLKKLTAKFNEELLAKKENTLNWQYYSRLAINQGVPICPTP